jgi:hypothetical protein
MPLIEGRYNLSHYVTFTSSEGDRRKMPREFFVRAGEVVTLEVPVFFNEKKYAAYRKHHEAEALPAVDSEFVVPDPSDVQSSKEAKNPKASDGVL